MGLSPKAGSELLEERFQPAAPEAALGERRLLPEQARPGEAGLMGWDDGRLTPRR